MGWFVIALVFVAVGATEPGWHLAVWDGRSDSGGSVGSGLYSCTMDAGGYMATHKMMLLK